MSCAVCQCVALHSISFYCTAFPCNALQYECSFTHCGAAGVHWWARGMGRHMVDKTWPGVRSSAAGAGGAGAGAAGGGAGKMEDDSLVPSGLLLPQSMDVHCQATIYPLFNAASLCVSSKFSYSILQQSLKFRNASLLCTRPSVINCLGRSSPPPHPPLAAVIGGSFGRGAPHWPGKPRRVEPVRLSSAACGQVNSLACLSDL